jgi:hypothetical protein
MGVWRKLPGSNLRRSPLGLHRRDSFRTSFELRLFSLESEENSVVWVRKRTIPTERPRLSANWVPSFADRGCHVVSVTVPYGHILNFLVRIWYVFFQVAPQLYSRGWVDPVPDPLLLRKSGSAGNRTQTSGSVARNSDHWTTEAVEIWTRMYSSLIIETAV